MGCPEDGASWGLIDSTGLDADVTVLHDIDAADSVHAAQLVDHLEDGGGGRCLLLSPHVHNLHGVSLLEEDLDVIWCLLALGKRSRVLVTAVGSGGSRVLKDPRLERDVEHVIIHAVGRLVPRVHRDGDPALLGVREQVLAALELVVELRDPPRHDALQTCLQSVGAELEANLVVALASGAVRDVIATFLLSDGHLGLGDARTGQGSSQEVAALVDGVGANDGEYVVLDKILLKIHHVSLHCAGLERLLLNTREVFVIHSSTLAKIRSERHDLVPMVRKPSQLGRGVQATRVGEDQALSLAILWIRGDIPPSSYEGETSNSPLRPQYSGGAWKKGQHDA
mmetsp:Transcript_21213/g.43056  ORF Transcript_21213/g.43056 Transcript_21213/m.43056 type:complete len:339 (+) Transcript_21213:728-1744(+)